MFCLPEAQTKTCTYLARIVNVPTALSCNPRPSRSQIKAGKTKHRSAVRTNTFKKVIGAGLIEMSLMPDSLYPNDAPVVAVSRNTWAAKIPRVAAAKTSDP
jgi:hypothetical protein